MKLPYKIKLIKTIVKTKEEIKAAILERRKVIRYLRDQKGDNRCWIDDYLVWAMLDDSPPEPEKLPDDEEMTRKCLEFYTHRRTELADPIPSDAITDSKLWDIDLLKMNQYSLLDELFGLQGTIKLHRDVIPPRTFKDDMWLYNSMPEKLPADFRLPSVEEFLGEKKGPHAGCPAFKRSHATCVGPCNIHAWGPCSKVH
ncbi:MAG: hypothetical protein Q7S72_01785 [Candidatus Taylorbacteria bacterium]|nr:hypothetical protein [Candidatus Taylorbacteria bacterium]